MVVFPNCKINLGLYITERRSDNYHNIETVFYPVPWHDVLEIIKHEAQQEQICFTTSGINLEINPKDNIVLKSYELICSKLHMYPKVKIHLHKNIPSGAGLGGGSADAASALKILNAWSANNLSQEALQDVALQLGSDCPFFLKNTPQYATSRGEIMQNVHINLSGYWLILIYPNIHISTKDLFAKIHPSKTKNNLIKSLQLPVHQWKNHVFNDFEKPVFTLYPQIKKIKEYLYAQGALYACLTGTGSTVFGIFENAVDIRLQHNDYLIKKVLL